MEPASRRNNRTARPINFFRQSTPAPRGHIAGTGSSLQTVPCPRKVIVSAYATLQLARVPSRTTAAKYHEDHIASSGEKH